MIERAFYLYHPDFIMDENEPNGYRILSTGKWVVEWDEIFMQKKKKKGFNDLDKKTHKQIAFKTEREAYKFYNSLMRHIDKDRQKYIQSTSYMKEKSFKEMLKINKCKPHLGI